MSTIEGGMVITNDFKQYEMLKMVRSNGWDRQLSYKNSKITSKKYNTNTFIQSIRSII